MTSISTGRRFLSSRLSRLRSAKLHVKKLVKIALFRVITHTRYAVRRITFEYTAIQAQSPMIGGDIGAQTGPLLRQLSPRTIHLWSISGCEATVPRA